MTRRSQTRENLCVELGASTQNGRQEAAWLRLVLSATATSKPPEGLSGTGVSASTA